MGVWLPPRGVNNTCVTYTTYAVSVLLRGLEGECPPMSVCAGHVQRLYRCTWPAKENAESALPLSRVPITLRVSRLRDLFKRLANLPIAILGRQVAQR